MKISKIGAVFHIQWCSSCNTIYA